MSFNYKGSLVKFDFILVWSSSVQVTNPIFGLFPAFRTFLLLRFSRTFRKVTGFIVQVY